MILINQNVFSPVQFFVMFTEKVTEALIYIKFFAIKIPHAPVAPLNSLKKGPTHAYARTNNYLFLISL